MLIHRYSRMNVFLQHTISSMQACSSLLAPWRGGSARIKYIATGNSTCKSCYAVNLPKRARHFILFHFVLFADVVFEFEFSRRSAARTGTWYITVDSST